MVANLGIMYDVKWEMDLHYQARYYLLQNTTKKYCIVLLP